MKQNYYQILGVAASTTVEQIKKAYKKLAKQFHPDKNQGNKDSEEKFKEINLAYEVLSNEEKRRNYDSALKQEQTRPFPPQQTYNQTGYQPFVKFGQFVFSVFIVIIALFVISDLKARIANQD